MSSSLEDRPRVLVLAPRFPYPVVGGDRLRIYEVCRELSKTCSLTLLSLCESQQEMQMQPEADGVFQRIERVYLPRWQSFFNVLWAIPGNTPLQLAYYRSREFGRRVKHELSRHDLCIAHLIRTGDYLLDSDVPRILEMTDAISLNYQRFKDSGRSGGWKAHVYRLEADRLAEYERSVVNNFDAVSLVSEVDRQFLLKGASNPRVFVCSNGVDLRRFPFQKPAKNSKVIAFIGNMYSTQNLDAVTYFARDVLPLLRLHGDFRFRVVGRIHASDAEKLENSSGVEVRGNVPSVVDEVRDAFAAVAPVRLGAGVQNKVLEYMALGLPVVASPIASEGLSAQAGKDLLVAENPEAYVEHILGLYRGPECALRLALAGRQYVSTEHSWEIQLAPFVKKVHDLAPGRHT